MPAPIQTPRTSWVEAGLQALGVGGPHAVRIESLAQTLGVTKGGFYWHFDGRRELLEEMLDSWEHAVTEQVIVLVEGEGGDARTKLGHLFDIATSIDGMVRVELAIREWARRDASVAARLRRIDNRRMAYMRSLFGELTRDADEVEARSFTAFALFIANTMIAAEHPDTSRADVIRAATERLIT